MEIKRTRILHKRLTREKWLDFEKHNLRQGELGILINDKGETQEVRIGVKDTQLPDGTIIGSPFSECLLVGISDSGSETVKSYTNYESFPSMGQETCIYIDKATNSAYRWDDNIMKYFSISSGTDWHEIEEIYGGNASLL